MMILLLLFLAPEPVMERTVYDVVLVVETRLYNLQLVVNRLDEDKFSIGCRKSPGGTLFTYWATETEDVLAFPRQKMLFEDKAGGAFRLFPDGPALHRGEWLALLTQGKAEALSGFSYQEFDDWRMIGSRERNVSLRWRERRRAQKTTYKARVFEPRRPDKWARSPLSEMNLTWNTDDLDDPE